MTKYLYGLSIKGIQSFIFQTNKLKEIGGASEWIEGICRDAFGKAVGTTFDKENLLQAAAGNIKYIFSDRQTCEKVVRTFVKSLKVKVPDLNVIQAVIAFEEEQLAAALQQINIRLAAQQNQVSVPHSAALMISKRSARTGKAGYKSVAEQDKTVLLDRGQYELRKLLSKTFLTEKLTGDNKIELPTDFAEIAKGQEKAWLAVIHADGNDMGAKFRELFNNALDKTDEEVKNAYKRLSIGLGEKTQAAAKAAFDQHIPLDELPIRPIIIGGDDVTFVIGGDLALDFTRTYLEEFAKGTKDLFQELHRDYPNVFKQTGDSITACAGIAYVKAHYPFHYAAHLAEELTKQAKKIAEVERKKSNGSVKQSCLVFHKVQSSFVENYDEIVDKELTAGKDDTIRLDFGPYFIGNAPTNYASTEQLSQWLEIIHEMDAPLGSLRNWLTELYQNEDVANNLWDKMLRLSKNSDYVARLGLNKPYQPRLSLDGKTYSHTHIFDVVSLASIHQAEK